jgi:dihydrofolate reductase
VSEFVSLDGVMEAPGGEPGYPHSGWVFDFMSPEQERYKLDEVLEAESLLLGRETYEGFSATWSERGGEFADKMNSMRKYVVSATLQDPSWDNTTVLRGDARDVAELKAREGGPILVAGSRTLVHALVEHGLVDEYRLMVFPVPLGNGKRVFPETADKTVLKLADHPSDQPPARRRDARLALGPTADQWVSPPARTRVCSRSSTRSMRRARRSPGVAIRHLAPPCTSPTTSPSRSTSGAPESPGVPSMLVCSARARSGSDGQGAIRSSRAACQRGRSGLP